MKSEPRRYYSHPCFPGLCDERPDYMDRVTELVEAKAYDELKAEYNKLDEAYRLNRGYADAAQLQSELTAAKVEIASLNKALGWVKTERTRGTKNYEMFKRSQFFMEDLVNLMTDEMKCSTDLVNNYKAQCEKLAKTLQNFYTSPMQLSPYCWEIYSRPAIKTLAEYEAWKKATDKIE